MIRADAVPVFHNSVRWGTGCSGVRLPLSAAIEAVFRVDAGGGSRFGCVSSQVRAVPLSDEHDWTARAGAAGVDESESNALGRAADG